ncbi:hypothetical protein BC829DRAFT_16638 [Chytridium lagenaria]|nr:hypothetical protein BC829DRAFT_16638 [Chytridium lagenaria]
MSVLAHPTQRILFDDETSDASTFAFQYSDTSTAASSIVQDVMTAEEGAAIHNFQNLLLPTLTQDDDGFYDNSGNAKQLDPSPKDQLEVLHTPPRPFFLLPTRTTSSSHPSHPAPFHRHLPLNPQPPLHPLRPRLFHTLDATGLSAIHHLILLESFTSVRALAHLRQLITIPLVTQVLTERNLVGGISTPGLTAMTMAIQSGNVDALRTLVGLFEADVWGVGCRLVWRWRQ